MSARVPVTKADWVKCLCLSADAIKEKADEIVSDVDITSSVEVTIRMSPQEVATITVNKVMLPILIVKGWDEE